MTIDPLAELKAQHALHDERHAMLRSNCSPEHCEPRRWLSLCDRLAAAVPPTIHAPTDHEVLAAEFSRAVDLLHAAERQRERALEQCAAAEEKAQRYLDRAHLMTQPCRCDPLWSGEELCNGGCDLTARLAAAEQERDKATAALEDRENLLAAACRTGQQVLDRLHGLAALLARVGVHQRSNPRCEGWSGAACTCGLSAALTAPPAMEGA